MRARLQGLSGEAIDRGLPVMYLMLSHADKEFDEYEWHWFNLTGYETREDGGMQVTFATWGTKCSFDFMRAWDTQVLAWRYAALSSGA